MGSRGRGPWGDRPLLVDAELRRAVEPEAPRDMAVWAGITTSMGGAIYSGGGGGGLGLVSRVDRLGIALNRADAACDSATRQNVRLCESASHDPGNQDHDPGTLDQDHDPGNQDHVAPESRPTVQGLQAGSARRRGSANWLVMILPGWGGS